MRGQLPSILGAIGLAAGVAYGQTAPGPEPAIDWGAQTFAFAAAGADAPVVRAGIAWSGPTRPALDQAARTRPVLTSGGAATTHRIAFALGAPSGVAYVAIVDPQAQPDTDGRFRFQVAPANGAAGAAYEMTLDIAASTGGVPDILSWVGFNPQPEPPGMPPGAAAIGFDLEIAAAAPVALGFEVASAGAPLPLLSLIPPAQRPIAAGFETPAGLRSTAVLDHRFTIDVAAMGARDLGSFALRSAEIASLEPGLAAAVVPGGWAIRHAEGAAGATALARLGWEVTESVPDAAGGPATTLVYSATQSIEIGWERKRVLSVLASAEAEALIAEPHLAGASATPVRDVQALSLLVETDPGLTVLATSSLPEGLVAIADPVVRSAGAPGAGANGGDVFAVEQEVTIDPAATTSPADGAILPASLTIRGEYVDPNGYLQQSGPDPTPIKVAVFHDRPRLAIRNAPGRGGIAQPIVDLRDRGATPRRTPALKVVRLEPGAGAASDLSVQGVALRTVADGEVDVRSTWPAQAAYTGATDDGTTLAVFLFEGVDRQVAASDLSFTVRTHAPVIGGRLDARVAEFFAMSITARDATGGEVVRFREGDIEPVAFVNDARLAFDVNGDGRHSSADAFAVFRNALDGDLAGVAPTQFVTSGTVSFDDLRVHLDRFTDAPVPAAAVRLDAPEALRFIAEIGERVLAETAETGLSATPLAIGSSLDVHAENDNPVQSAQCLYLEFLTVINGYVATDAFNTFPINDGTLPDFRLYLRGAEVAPKASARARVYSDANAIQLRPGASFFGHGVEVLGSFHFLGRVSSKF